MKKYSRILIIANLLLLLGYFNWSVYKKDQTLKDGQLVLLQLSPVDPRSLMQGDYMRLNYKESDSLRTQALPRGYAILKVDSNHIGKVIRLQKDLKPIYENELIIKYKTVYNRILLGAESFFFEEGQSMIYEPAVYGGLKVDNRGESLLVGLYDENFRLLEPDK